jgi:hypothetical protein
MEKGDSNEGPHAEEQDVGDSRVPGPRLGPLVLHSAEQQEACEDGDGNPQARSERYVQRLAR